MQLGRAQCLARAAGAAVARNTVAAWQEFPMLPKAVLSAPVRGVRVAARRLHQLRAAAAFGGLMESAVVCGRSLVPSGPPLTLEARHSRCKRLAAEGDLSRACTALIAPPALAPSPDTLSSLQAKHPQAPLPDLDALGPPRFGAVPDFDTQAGAEAVRGFKRGSAPGPSGLRADHLREALLSAHADEVVANLAALCQLLARGEAPATLASHLAGATLHALPKKQGGVRPIAVGEVLRRLVGKLWCQAVREESRAYLWPLQVGVGVPSGCEAAVHATRGWLHRNSGHADKILLKLDFRNAFNSIDRTALLRQVRAHAPECACWADWCYGCSSRLLFGDDVLQSTCGVQQGDPLGPFFFALVLQPALAAAEGPLDLRYAFLDDVVLAGNSVPVTQALGLLVAVVPPAVPTCGGCLPALLGVAGSLNSWALHLGRPPIATSMPCASAWTEPLNSCMPLPSCPTLKLPCCFSATVGPTPSLYRHRASHRLVSMSLPCLSSMPVCALALSRSVPCRFRRRPGGKLA